MSNPELTGNARPFVVDPYRFIVFPNRMREWRQKKGYPKLLGLAAHLPDIPYIRLSKLERGEVAARAAELIAIGQILGIDAAQLLLDMEDPTFDIGSWAEPFRDVRPRDLKEEQFAVLLGAALRVRRQSDRTLSIAALDKEYGLPPVILSRIENGHKTLNRWNETTLLAIFSVLGVTDENELRHKVAALYAQGALHAQISAIVDPAGRIARTKARIEALAKELRAIQKETVAKRPSRRNGSAAVSLVSTRAARQAQTSEPGGGSLARSTLANEVSTIADPRLLPLFGAPLPGGLIAMTPTGGTVEAPRVAGPRAFGLKVCKPTLGGSLPGQAALVVDPDRFPSGGGLAAIREDQGYRLVMITFDRDGIAKGHSINPALEIGIDELDPARVATVVSAVFV